MQGDSETLPQTRRFRVLERLGAGGMGDVYRAYDSERHTEVALKIVRATSGEELIRFKREFRAVANLRHPNLVSLGELLEDEGRFLISMELVKGRDLFAWVGKSEARLRKALSGVAHGLAALHRAGLVHRDVKSKNILVTDEGRAVVLDFGLVRDRTQADIGGKIYGTVIYMAPEQTLGADVDARADWYSFGILLYILLTGERPFKARNTRELIEEKLTTRPPSPRALRPEVPADLSLLCERLIDRDRTARPTFDEIIATLHASAVTSPGDLKDDVFVGRSTELAALNDAFAATGYGRPVTTFVVGESGVGKSELVREFARHASERPATFVISGRCYERESVPFKGIDGAIDGLCIELMHRDAESVEAALPTDMAALCRAFPVLRKLEELIARAPIVDETGPAPAPLQERRRAAFAALRELLSRLCRRFDVALIIDDLQWSDADSLALLAELLRPPAAPPILLVATVRENDDVDRLAAALKHQSTALDIRRLSLASLPPPDAARLANELAHGRDIDPDALAAECGGHPLLLRELIESAGSRGKIDDVLRARAKRLPQLERRLLDVAAVAGVPLDEKRVAALLQAPLNDVSEAIARLRAARLVRTSTRDGTMSCEPYHDRVREAVASAIAPEDLREIHAALARVVDPADPLRLLAHLRGAGDTTQQIDVTLAAARRARDAFAFDASARLYREALALRGHDPDLLAELGDALTSAGRGADAARAYLSSAGEGKDDVSVDRRRRGAEELLRAGHFEEGKRVLARLLTDFNLKLPTSTTATLLGLLSREAQLRVRGTKFVLRRTEDIDRALLRRIDACWCAAQGLGGKDNFTSAYFQTLHMLLSLDAGDPYRLARAFALQGGFFAVMGGDDGDERARAANYQARVLADQCGHPHAQALCMFFGGFIAAMRGRYTDAVDLCDRAERLVRTTCPDAHWERANAIIYSLTAHAAQGSLAECARRIPGVVAEADGRGDLYTAVNAGLGLMNLVWLAGDDSGAARAVVNTAIERWGAKTFTWEDHLAVVARAHADLYDDNPERARAAVIDAWPRHGFFRRVVESRARILDLQARAALACAVRKEGAARTALVREARAANAKLAKLPTTWSAPAARLNAGTAFLLDDKPDRARLELDVARSALRDAGLRLHAAVAAFRYGELVGGDEGKAHLEESRKFFEAQRIVKPDRFLAMF